tara:strand:+ start:167 stop:349 length:183 start_codon:yes stop_codon:yes gene_type:complete
MALSKKDYMKLCDLEMELDKIQDELKILFSFSIESGLGTDEETALENKAIAIRREMAQFN